MKCLSHEAHDAYWSTRIYASPALPGLPASKLGIDVRDRRKAGSLVMDSGEDGGGVLSEHHINEIVEIARASVVLDYIEVEIL